LSVSDNLFDLCTDSVEVILFLGEFVFTIKNFFELVASVVDAGKYSLNDRTSVFVLNESFDFVTWFSVFTNDQLLDFITKIGFRLG
jgi:hypothetical protein